VTNNTIATRRLAVIPAALACVVLSACHVDCPEKLVRCRKDLGALREENILANKSLAQARESLARQTRRIKALQGLPEDRPAHLIVTDRIKLAKLTGAYDSDKDGYDDGIVIYLQPIDADGHAIKVAGEIDVRLFDLSAAAPRPVGRATVPAEKAHTHWYGHFWTHHFTIRCPFSQAPAGGKVTARVKFVEWFTQKEFTTQAVCKVRIRSATSTGPVERTSTHSERP